MVRGFVNLYISRESLNLKELFDFYKTIPTDVWFTQNKPGGGAVTVTPPPFLFQSCDTKL